MASAGTVTLELDANSVKMIRELQKAQKQTKRTATQMRRDMTDAFKGIAAGAAILGGALAVAVKKSVEVGDKIGKTAKAVGLSAEQYQELAFAAKRAGIEQSLFSSSLTAFVKRVGEAQTRGAGPLVSGLKGYNDELLKALTNSKNQAQAFRILANATKNAATDTERAAIMNAAFGRSGVIMVNMMRDGTAGLDSMAMKARELGIVLSDEAVRGAEEAADKLGDLQEVIKVRIAETVLENADAIVALAESITELVIATGKAVQEVPSFMRWLGESVASYFHGPAFDDIPRREDEIAALEERLRKHRIDANRMATETVNGVKYMDPEARAHEIYLMRLIALKKEQLEVDRKLIEQSNAPTINIKNGQSAGAVPVLDPPSENENAEEIKQIISKLMSEVKTFGMTDGEKGLLQLIDMDATYEQLTAFAEAVEQMEKLKEQERIAGEELETIVVTAQRLPDVLTDAQIVAQSLAETFSSIGASAFASWVDGSKSAKEAFADMAKDMLRWLTMLIVKEAILAAFGYGSGSGGSFSLAGAFGKRAEGGPIMGGQAYLVGEKGPELIVPRSSGYVVPNDKLGGGNVTVNVDARESDDPGKLLALIPVIQAQVEQSIGLKSRRGYV